MPYSFLYGSQDATIRAFANKMIKGECPPSNFSASEKLQCSTELKWKLSMLLTTVQLALEAGCPGDSCLHEVWWMCGGAAAFVKGHTSTYTDVDFFVHCRGDFDMDAITAVHFTSPTIVSKKGIVLDLQTELNGGVQIIPVCLEVDISWAELRLSPYFMTYQELMAVFILSRFDMPACRVSIKFSYTAMFDGPLHCRVVDLSLIEHFNRLTLDRLFKWENRKVPSQKTVPKLSALVPFSVFLSAEKRRLNL